MKTKHITGTTAFNDSLNLPEGMISIDQEKKALRFYDGVTPGGYEAIGQRAVTRGPGPQTVIAGDETTGFLGEVSSTEFITGNALSSMVGLSTGNAHNSDTPWLKFLLDDKILYSPKATIRYNLDRRALDTRSLIYGGVTVTIKGYLFMVRLFKGLNVPSVSSSGGTLIDPPETHGSEWNRLMYPLMAKIPGSQAGGNWTVYPASELGFIGNGRVTIAQEFNSINSFDNVIRGNGEGVDYTHYGTFSGDPQGRGWRPVLELIQ